jgi:hypothetical protein
MKLNLIVFAIACAIGAPTIIHAAPAKENMKFLENPRYKANPVDFFFENYILDVVGQLASDKAQAIQAMNLQKIFKTKSNEWRESVRETLHLSNTIDIAILDLWYRNQEIALAQGTSYSAPQFAMNFVDEYMKDGSRVDVWPPGALAAAEKRISNQQAKASLRKIN